MIAVFEYDTVTKCFHTESNEKEVKKKKIPRVGFELPLWGFIGTGQSRYTTLASVNDTMRV